MSVAAVVAALGLALTPPLPFGSCAWVRVENDAAGAGFVVDAGRRWLVTCRHIVAERAAVEVFFPWHRGGELVTDKRDYLGNRVALRERGLLVRGKVLRRSEAADLALVELESLPPGTQAVPLAAVPARPGDPVRVIGHRQDLDTLWNVTTGPVRQIGRLADGYSWRGTKLAVDADSLIGQWPTEEGDSGGPVLNARGEAVGMATAQRRGTPLAAVAVSAAEIRRFVKAGGENEQADPPAVAESLFRATVWVRPTATDVHTAGVLVDRERGWVLTSARGLGPADRVGVAFPLRDGGRWVGEREPYRDPVGLHLRGAWRAATVIARDPARDLALLRLDSVPESARAVPVAANPPAPGDAVHVMNHPGGLEFAWVYAGGSVRQRGRVALAAGDDSPRVAVTVLQVPAQAQSPGGPMLNDRGELVGVLAARDGPQQVGYAATTEDVARFLDGIPTDRPARTLLGLFARIEAVPARLTRLAATALVTRAREQTKAHRVREALQDYAAALRFDPRCTEAYMGRYEAPAVLGWNSDDSELMDAADKGRFSRTVLLNRASLYRGLALSYDRLGGEPKQSRETWQLVRSDLQRILDVDPADAGLWQKFVRPLLELGKDAEAATAVRNTLRLDSTRLREVAFDLSGQADRLAQKFPDTPAPPAGWLVRALTAAATAVPDPAKADIEAALKRADAAKGDAERLALLREFVAKLAAVR
jgi:S1-C subfamily serine protease